MVCHSIECQTSAITHTLFKWNGLFLLLLFMRCEQGKIPLIHYHMEHFSCAHVLNYRLEKWFCRSDLVGSYHDCLPSRILSRRHRSTFSCWFYEHAVNCLVVIINYYQNYLFACIEARKYLICSDNEFKPPSWVKVQFIWIWSLFKMIHQPNYFWRTKIL